jgi:hypothetical protein
MSRGWKISAWIIGVVVALFLLSFLEFAGFPPVATLLIYLIGGWIRYLGNALPRVTVSGDGVLLMALCLALAATVGHGFCHWLWKGTGHETPWRPKWTFAGLGTLVLMFAAGMAVTGVVHQTGWLLRSPEPLMSSGGNQRNASASLKTITSAQADFRGNDRDGNGKQDYWRGDIAGLYAILPAGSAEPIKLIELSVALADGHPVTAIEKFGTRGPKAGFWYRALAFKGETTPNPDRFAACSFPVNVSAGRWMFIISEENVIYRKPFNGSPPEFYPDDPAKDGWSKLD